MTIRPCKCGATPKFHRQKKGHVFLMQLRCDCGAHGAVLMFTKREDAPKMKQAAADGWNLAE